MPDRPGAVLTVVIDSSVDKRKTTACQVPAWARYGAVYIPAITNANISCEIAEHDDVRVDAANVLLPTQDTEWNAVADTAENQVIAAADLEDVWIDITNYLQAIPQNCWFRLVVDADEAGTAALTYRISFRGA